MQVYVLYYIENDGEDGFNNVETIGVYSSLEKAQEIMNEELQETIALNENRPYSFSTDISTHECTYTSTSGYKLKYCIDEQTLYF